MSRGASLRYTLRGLGYFIRIGSVFYLLREHVLCTLDIRGPSMYPTFYPQGDIILLNKLPPRYGTLNRGDIIVSKKKNAPIEMAVKRIRGVEGDEIEYWNRPAVVRDTGKIGGKAKVPRGHIWLEGDNPSMSRDSREYGPVPIGLVEGRVVCRIWPPSRIGWLEEKKLVVNAPGLMGVIKRM